jgi:RHS repeat-associated protein
VFSAYGQLLSQTNPSAGSAVAAVNCLFAYTGEALSSFSENATTGAVDGLQNNDERWYDAITGRWLSQDPSGFAAGDANLYCYCGNAPTIAVDPSGLFGEPVSPRVGPDTVGPRGCRPVNFGRHLPSDRRRNLIRCLRHTRIAFTSRMGK